MSSTASRVRIAFLDGPPSTGYGRSLGRWRWRRAYGSGAEAVVVSPDAPAGELFAGPSDWLAVLNSGAVPLPGEQAPAAEPGRVVVAADVPSPPPQAHTLRELEQAPPAPMAAGRGEDAAAILFRGGDFPAAPNETAATYLRRLARDPAARAFQPGLAALVLDTTGSDRAEVTAHFPRPIPRLLDVGCGTGKAGAALKREMPSLHVTGIEKDSASAAAAREVLDRVIEGEAPDALASLAAEGARFDALLFADVLEHLVDPIEALRQARALAEAEATLLASVPNAGHLSLVRDLLFGRFDPVPAGLADAGHLRWFTKTFLREALEEGGWQVDRVEGLPGAPAPEAAAFLSRLSDWPGADPESLATYQWLAVARAGERSG
ncbi:MAG: class I SAM-dependent methyltransferase [Thermoanaerobaculia bacterium]